MKERMEKIAKKENIISKSFALTILYLIIRLKPEKEIRLYNSIKNNVPKEKQNDKKYMKVLIKDMIYCHYVSGFNYEEYFAFELENKTDEERHQYVGTLERYDLLKDFTTKESQKKFDDKYLCYKIFQPYYAREIEKITKNDFDTFCNFANRQRVFMVKPIALSLGQGISIIDLDAEERNTKEIFNSIVSNGDVVLEEMIYQSFSMAIFHPASVNTIRFVTCFDGKETNRLYALVRMGVGNSFVDNAFTGGIIASVDVDTGVILTDGYRNKKNIDERYSEHPETKVKIKGNQIPKWQELLNLIEKLVRVVPEQKIVGWDLALTDSGWIMVEGNSRPIFKSVQLCNKKGFRTEFEKIRLMANK